MKPKTKINEEWAEELKRVRKKYKLSISLFSRLLRRSRKSIYIYEDKTLGISEEVIDRVRFIDKVLGELMNVS